MSTESSTSIDFKTFNRQLRLHQEHPVLSSNSYSVETTGSGETMEIKYLYFLAIIHFYPMESALVQPFHSGLSQNASVACTMETNLTLTFFLQTGSDLIGAIFTVNHTDISRDAFSTFSKDNGQIVGNGTSDNPYQFSVVVPINMSDPNPLYLTSDAETALAYIENNEVLGVDIMVKSNNSLDGNGPNRKVIFPEDVLYQATCNISDINELVLSSNSLTVNGKIDEKPDSTSRAAVLSVYDSNNETTSSIVLGDLIYLHIHSPQPTSLKGLRATSCLACDTSDCNGKVAVEFIDSNGCSVASLPTFEIHPNNVLATGMFKSFRFSHQNLVYFQCNVALCYSDNDPTCATTCGGARRKRDTTNDELVKSTFSSTYVEVKLPKGKTEGDISQDIDRLGLNINQRQQREEEESLMRLQNSALLGSVISLTVLLLVGMLAAVLVFKRFTAQKLLV